MRIKLLIMLLCLVNFQTFAQTKRYDQILMSKIKLLSTTHEQAEKIIGKKIKRYGDMATVEVPYGMLIFIFSMGHCSENTSSGWDLPDGIVTSVEFSSKRKLRVSGFNFRSMRVAYDPNPTNPPQYIDDSRGIYYQTSEGRVITIAYEPLDKFDHLRCKQKEYSN